MEIIKKEEYPISEQRPVVTVIQDPNDVDMKFTIKLARNNKDKSCYTQYVVHNSQNADIIIYNSEESQAYSPSQHIYLGTYSKQYDLYLNYYLKPKTNHFNRSVILTFLINRNSGHGSRG